MIHRCPWCYQHNNKMSHQRENRTKSRWSRENFLSNYLTKQKGSAAHLHIHRWASASFAHASLLLSGFPTFGPPAYRRYQVMHMKPNTFKQNNCTRLISVKTQWSERFERVSNQILSRNNSWVSFRYGISLFNGNVERKKESCEGQKAVRFMIFATYIELAHAHVRRPIYKSSKDMMTILYISLVITVACTGSTTFTFWSWDHRYNVTVNIAFGSLN